MKNKQRRKRPTTNNKDKQTNERLINECARIYVNESVKDLHSAKLKAAKHLGLTDARNLPSNEDVEQAIKNYQRLFTSSIQMHALQSLQQDALRAMAFFEHFQPRIVGALLKGTASCTSTIHLHLFTDQPEEVDWFLLENKIPHEVFNKVYYLNKQKQASTIPAYSFVANDNAIELSVFPEVNLRQQVRSAVKGQAIERENVSNFKQLLSATE